MKFHHLVKSFLVITLLSGSLSFGIGEPAELCVGEIHQNECLGEVYGGGFWGHPEGQFYLRFYVGQETDLWATFTPNGQGHSGQVVLDQFSPDEASYAAEVVLVEYPFWSEIVFPGLELEQKISIRKLPFS